MALEREPRILRLHPFPIVFDLDLLLAAELDVNPDASRARVERVLDELLDDGRGAFDDLARRYLVGKISRKEMDLGQLRRSRPDHDLPLLVESAACAAARRATGT